MLKSERHVAIRERARAAIRDLYHNATPEYPRNVEDEHQDLFQSWFEGAAQFEIEYIQDGGAYGSNYPKTLRHEVHAGRFKSQAAQDFYVRKEMRKMRCERARCNSLDSRERQTNAQWERIGEFGKVYQYGRGGRTLAPEKLIRGSGYHWRVDEDYADDLPIADVVDLIHVVESFNRHCADWCASVPEQWREYLQEEIIASRCEAAVLSNN